MNGPVVPEIEVWLSEKCPGCGRPVAFLRGQYVNVCGWCRSVVCRGLE